MKENEIDKKEGEGIMTAVDIAIFNSAGEILLGKRLASAGLGMWGFPGGHLKTREKILICAQREIREELGEDAKIELSTNTLGVRENSISPHFIHHLTVIIEGRYKGGEIKVNEPDRCEEWSWFQLDKLPDSLFSGVKDTIENFKEKKSTVISDWRDK